MKRYIFIPTPSTTPPRRAGTRLCAPSIYPSMRLPVTVCKHISYSLTMELGARMSTYDDLYSYDYTARLD